MSHILYHIFLKSTTKVPPSRIELFYEIGMFISPVFDIKCPPICPVSWTTWILHYMIRIMSSNNSVFIQRIFLSASIPTYGSTNIKCIWIRINWVIRIWCDIKWVAKIIGSLKFYIESVQISGLFRLKPPWPGRSIKYTERTTDPHARIRAKMCFQIYPDMIAL